MTIRTLCVYCGSGPGLDEAYAGAANELGAMLAGNAIRLVYGGGSLGLMGLVARSVLRHGGQVTGIIPEFLVAREKMLRDVDDLIITKDMHERKRLMFERSDGFVALPGGIGTLEETVEMLTWSQLGQHEKPVVLANIKGFWDPLLALFDHMRGQQFIRDDLPLRYVVAETIGDILPRLEEARRAPAAVHGEGAPSLSNL